MPLVRWSRKKVTARQPFKPLSESSCYMTNLIGHGARIPNPALEPLTFLIGEWSTVGSHPMLPGRTLRGRTSFAWAEGGAFLVMRSEIDEPEVPSGIGFIGTDDDSGECSMLYFDQRGVSRRYLMSLRSDRWHWWRDDPGFSQRFTGTLEDGGKRIVGKGEMRRDGGTWEGDLALTYTRVQSR